MKSLSQYINEAGIPASYYVQKFDSFVAEFTRIDKCKAGTSLSNKTDAKKVYALFLSWLKDKAGGATAEVLRKVGINNASEFTSYMYDHAEDLEKEKASLEKFKDFQMSETEKAYKAYKKDHEEEFAAVSEDDAEERDLVVYDRYDPATHKIYGFRGKRGKNTDHQVNMFRVDFHYETGTKYYNCYSCLYSYYIEHKKDLEHYADYIGDND